MINFVFASFFSEFLFLVVLPFVVWMISRWSFICGKLTLGSDAFLYYFDSRFFLENISHGVYPLWNPDYSGGVPWNFFLRRIGEVNPLYWIITGLKLLGVSALHAYLIFVVLYFFLGLVGFWLLARLFLRDRLTSTGAYLLLLFSWGGQIFYCFDVLMLVPLVWFFYFLLAFGREQKKHQFLGICFSMALMVTTYIPFFTLTIVGFFLFFLFLFFMKESINFLKISLNFIRTHKIFAAMALGFLLLSYVPAIGFYVESKEGGFVLPTRHLGSLDSSEVSIAVDLNNSSTGINVPRTIWDILASGYFDKVFSNQHDMNMGDFFIAYPFFIVLILSIINPVSRRTALLLVSGVFLTLSVMTKGYVYPFLLNHVFFFRYMRMLQLFFWLAVLPIGILMVMEQLRVFLCNHAGRKNIKVLVFVILAHVLFAAWLLTQSGVAWGSYLALVMSLVFFILSLMGYEDRRVLALILWLSLLVQPVEITGYISQTCEKCEKIYITDHSSRYAGHFPLLKRTPVQPLKGIKPQDAGEIDKTGYYENPWVYNAKQVIYKNTIQTFAGNHLLLFDNTMPEDDVSDENFFAKLSRMWGSLQNLVFLPLDRSVPEDFRSLAPSVLKSQVVYEGDPEVKVLSYDANTLRLQTDLNRSRFLLWTNGYHSAWHVYIDGHEGRLLRADYAFKGVWVPAGDHTIVFRFATPLRYAGAIALMAIFGAMLAMIVILSFSEGLLVEKEVAFEN